MEDTSEISADRVSAVCWTGVEWLVTGQDLGAFHLSARTSLQIHRHARESPVCIQRDAWKRRLDRSLNGRLHGSGAYRAKTGNQRMPGVAEQQHHQHAYRYTTGPSEEQLVDVECRSELYSVRTQRAATRQCRTFDGSVAADEFRLRTAAAGRNTIHFRAIPRSS